MNNIKIGKNAIENLTLGMYEDSKIIYREYIQNSADAIDKALQGGVYTDDKPFIDISIDEISRIVRIRDNAMGIKKDEVHQKLADVADSDKEKGIDKGFRGIGRLGGLAYCDTLRFITTYKGENVLTIMTWDAKELIRMINDATVKYSAEQVLSKVISYTEETCDVNEHYFIVELDNIRNENSELLNVSEVRKYISANAPVPYSNKFYYRTDIKNFINDNGLQICEYEIFVEGEDVFKNYCTYLYENSGNQKKKYDEISSIEFKKFKTNKGELLAWMWFGLSAFDKQIPNLYNEMRGIRLRKENIQIGNSDTLVKLFKEIRGNYYFIGELHAVHKDLVPNARRDYFNENQIRVEFEEQVKYFFGETLHKLYVDANKVKNAFKKEAVLVEKKSEYAAKNKKGFINPDDQKKMEEEVKTAVEENEQAKRDLLKLKEKSKGNIVFAKVIDVIEKKHYSSIGELKTDTKLVDKKNESSESKKPPLIVDNLHRLNKEQRKLISRVYWVINNVLPPELSENLIKKIQDELNKYEKKSITNRTQL